MITIDPKINELIGQYTLPRPLGFGTNMAPIMAQAKFENEKWGPLEVLPYGPISIEPSAKVFHYAQEIFEGIKAYKRKDAEVAFFRPEENYKRFNFSAQRMAMPDLPKEHFIEGIKTIASHLREHIPSAIGESLYIRPFMFATQAQIGIKPSNQYLFMIIASPCASYFKNDSVAVYIQREYVRAVKGGTGNAKTGGNYAAALLSSEAAFKKGFQQSIWLDAIEKRYIEELSGMNFFALINGELYTPKLTDSILAGITRKSIIELAEHLNLKCHEVHMDINDLIPQIKSGECSEAFACGTAAIVTPINSLNDDNEVYKFKNTQGEISKMLRTKLLNIQQGLEEDALDWTVIV